LAGGAGDRMCQKLGEVIRIGRWRGGQDVSTIGWGNYNWQVARWTGCIENWVR